jgi:hypothetical protein
MHGHLREAEALSAMINASQNGETLVVLVVAQ